MPIFEYQCEECHGQFERLLRGNESVACPACGSESLEKLLSTPAAHVRNGNPLPISSACPPSDAPPCSPNCCRL